MGVTALVFSLYALGAAWLREFVMHKPVVMRWINRSFAISFGVLAVMLGATNP